MQANPQTKNGTDYLSREKAMQLLGIKAGTLYTYVSRGWIRSTAGPDKKLKLYSREDIEKLRTRGHAKSGERFTANDGLRWGEPILNTSITQLSPAGPKYRNRLAVDLVRAHCSFEAVAELLWSGTWLDDPISWHFEPPLVNGNRLLSSLGDLKGMADIVQTFSLLTLAAGIAEHNRTEIKRGTTILAARQLIASMVGCFGFISRHHSFTFPESAKGVAEGLARALAIRVSEENVSALNNVLVLVADHEMTPPTFAARVAASSGADLYSCILAALSTHTGTRVRNACGKVEEMFVDAPSDAQFRRHLKAPQKSGVKLPGFNHPLYPGGDPRARVLIEFAKNMKDQTKHSERFYKLIDFIADEFHVQPSVEAGVVAVCFALDLPKQSAVGLLTLGRTAGWVAHVLEQRLAGIMLRPTTRYVGLD